MKPTLNLTCDEMTPRLMQFLEDKGAIIRLAPGTHEVITPEEEVGIDWIYKTDEKYGSHMLLSATINRSTFAAFGTHPDNEEVYLIGDPATKPLYFLFGLCKRDEFEYKLKSGTISSDDFLCFKARFNDVEVCCFSILKDFPHGEATIPGPEKPPTFFVTEQTNLPLDKIILDSIDIRLIHKSE
jgi:hypothetical protein